MAGVTVRDKGLNALMARLKASKLTVTVGVHAAEGSAVEPGGATVADVATWNHFGTSRIPARPFLTGWFDAHQPEIAEKLRAAAKLVAQGTSPRDALERVALWAAGGVQAGIAAGVPPANAESTIAQKGSSTPLINTGVLRSSIRGRVS